VRDLTKTKPVTATEASDAVADAVGQETAVVAAYLFGSAARGDAGPMSDVDVGLLLAAGADVTTICDRIAAQLCRRLRTDAVDVISLLDASPPLRYRALRDGKVIVCRDRAAHESLVVRTVLEYLDFKPLRDRALALVRRSILREA
jgi:predicted nucleotidyltransferase